MSYVLQLDRADELLSVRRQDFTTSREVTVEEFDHMLRICDGLWLHSGDPSAPHAELTSGKCSDGFVNTMRLLKYPNISMILAEELAGIYLEYFNYARRPDWVIGASYAAITFSQNVALCLRAKHAFTEKGSDGKTQLWRRETIPEGEVVLQVEELVSTTATFDRVRTGIVEGNANSVTFDSVSMTLVHRSPAYEFDGSPILFFRHYDINQWKPEECPLCAAGSPRLRPKQHWAELTAA
jgi:orotate phosphoribosyltransferase